MAKALDAPYEAGRRGAGWLKIKSAHTLDLVVIAVEWGSGRRKGWLSNLHLGARDPRSGGFVMLGKTFKGLTDETLEWQTRELLAREIRRDEWTVHVRPELVVEIAFNDVQQSPHYPGGHGAALRAREGLPARQARRRSRYYRDRAAHLRGAGVRRSLAEWLAFIEQQHPQPIALGLERVAAGLGSECRSDCNARSSRSAAPTARARPAPCSSRSCARRARRTGLYTSPHLLRYNERVRIAGAEASDDALCAGLRGGRGRRATACR